MSNGRFLFHLVRLKKKKKRASFVCMYSDITVVDMNIETHIGTNTLVEVNIFKLCGFLEIEIGAEYACFTRLYGYSRGVKKCIISMTRFRSNGNTRNEMVGKNFVDSTYIF